MENSTTQCFCDANGASHEKALKLIYFLIHAKHNLQFTLCSKTKPMIINVLRMKLKL